MHGIRFVHPMGEGDTAVSRLLDRLLSRRREAGGAPETVNCVGFVAHAGDYTGTWGASFRLLADIADPERSRWQHMTGQSGHPGSPHYDDLIDDGLPAARTLSRSRRSRSCGSTPHSRCRPVQGPLNSSPAAASRSSAASDTLPSAARWRVPSRRGRSPRASSSSVTVACTSVLTAVAPRPT